MNTYNNINSDTFCVNPWYWLRINALGEIAYCARASDYWSKSLGSFSEDFKHNSMSLDARASMLAGKFPQACNRCKAEESSGGSFRKSQNFRAAIQPNWFYQSLTQSPVYQRLHKSNISPHAIFVMFSNQCNLACRMCSRMASDRLSDIYNQHNHVVRYSTDYQTLSQHEQLDSLVVRSWSDDPVRWNDFLDFVANNRDLQILQINGGEPFVQWQLYALIEHLLLSQRQDLKLVITTNGTVVDHDLMHNLQKFDSCFIDVSLETLTESNNYIRAGSDYKKVLNNLEQLLRFSTDRLALGVHLTPQIYSVESLDTLLDFCISNNLEVVANQVHLYRCLQISVLPPEIKEQLHQRLCQKYKDLTIYSDSVALTIKKLFNWLSGPEPDDIADLRRLFVLHTQAHDRMLNTDFTEMYPHLVDYYKDYGYERY